MPGIDAKRFTELDNKLAKVLTCGICLDIFDKAVDTECGHTFCKSCFGSIALMAHVEDTNGQNPLLVRCPECRHVSTIAKLDGEWRLKNNHKINNIIDIQLIRCDFADNGCDEVREYGLLSAHLKVCAFNICSLCGLSFGGNREQHNCLSLLKNANKELNDKCEQMSEQINTLMIKRDINTDEDSDRCHSVPLRTNRNTQPNDHRLIRNSMPEVNHIHRRAYDRRSAAEVSALEFFDQ